MFQRPGFRVYRVSGSECKLCSARLDPLGRHGRFHSRLLPADGAFHTLGNSTGLESPIHPFCSMSSWPSARYSHTACKTTGSRRPSLGCFMRSCREKPRSNKNPAALRVRNMQQHMYSTWCWKNTGLKCPRPFLSRPPHGSLTLYFLQRNTA